MPRLLPQLPLEIIIHILSRLPLKPLLRFKCVSKSWCSLISNNPQFAKLHLQYAKLDSIDNRHRLFLSTYPYQSVDHEAYCDGHEYNTLARELIYPVKTPEDIEFVGSCDGLISAVFDSNPQIIVWNPSTGKSRELPSTYSFPDDMLFYGFGYDSCIDDYKIVRGIISSFSKVKMEVFSLKGCTWRTIQDLHCTVSFKGSATYLNGILHWVGEENGSNKRTVIVSFDLAEEKFLEMIPVPDHVPKYYVLECKVLGDFLCVCDTTHTPYCEAWTIKGYGAKASWNRLFSFSSDPLPGCKYWFYIFCVAKNGNILFNLDGWELVLYNPKDQSSKESAIPNDYGDSFEGITFIESLVSPNPCKVFAIV